MTDNKRMPNQAFNNDKTADKKNMSNNDIIKPKTAVALSYEPDEMAPRVIAAGKGLIAERIVERAKAADVPLHKDEQLANQLSKLELGSFIPPEAYEIVAEIITFVDRLDRIKGKLDHK